MLGQANLRGVAITIRFRVVEGTDPEDVPCRIPASRCSSSRRRRPKTCMTEGATSSATTIACTLGRLASGAWEMITVTSPRWFKFEIRMELTTRGEAATTGEEPTPTTGEEPTPTTGE